MIAVTLGGERWDRCREVYPDAVAFAGTPAATLRIAHPPDAKRAAIADTYQRLATFAVETGFDSLVIQDDVRFWGPTPAGYGIFGRRKSVTHWCPQAFRFDRATWQKAATLWDGQAQVCRAWEPLWLDVEMVDLASDDVSHHCIEVGLGVNALDHCIPAD